MNVTHIADANNAIAFHAFYTLVTPALRAATRHHLRAVFHPHRSCQQAQGVRSGPLCADCAAVVDDLALDTFVRLRRAIAAQHTGLAAPAVRELAAVAAHILSAPARHETVPAMAVQLARLNLTDPVAGPPWLRAAKAQLVYYPTRHLAAQLRRSLAVTRQGAAKPDRDLNTAAWAVPLRTPKAGLELLIAFIYRIRLGVADPYPTPPDIRDRHQLDVAAADELLRTTLRRLRELRPDFFYANVHTPLAITTQVSLDTVAPVTGTDTTAPERRLLAKEAAAHARTVLHRLVNRRPGEGPQWRPRRHAYRQILLMIARVADGDPHSLVSVCTQRLGLAEVTATRMLKRLAHLVATADADWVEDLLGTTPAG